MNNTNNALETLVQRDKQIKKTNDKLKASINELNAELESTTNALSTHASNTDIHTSKEELIQLIIDHLESLDLGITKEVVSVLPTENISDNTLYFVPNDKGSHNEYLYINDMWELVGSTETNFTDYYTKLETNTLLEGKANSVHNHVVSDITDFPTIPTKLSQLENDMGFGSGSGGVITSISWTNITDKPNFSTVATSGSYNDLSNKPTIPNVYNKTLTIQKNGTNVATFTSNSNTDVTADITVPTKVSELSNDSGFITGISWDKVTNKPTLATVATSGSYTDLSNTPTIPTKVSQLENDTGFVSGLTDVVDTKSNQTIGGTKTFTNGPWVINSQTTMGYSIKNTALARNEIPTEYQHHTFRAYDKNSNILGEYCIEKTTYGEAILNMGVRSEDSSGNQIAHGLHFRMTNDGSLVRFMPSANNKVHLGDPGAKWLKVHSDDVVHTTGTETIAGNKTFTNQIYLGAGGTSYGLISAKDNNSILRLFGGTSPSTGANLDLYGEGLSDGGFSLRARTSDKIVGLDGKIDGTLKWNGKNVALDENLVHKTGREVISGDKIFQNTIYRQADITTSTVGEVYRFTDTNATPCGSIYNRMHWYNNNVYNRHQAYNATSGKDMYFEVLSHTDGSGVVNTGGSVTNNKNLTTVTNATGNSYVATMGWVNNPATSTNVVHRSGNETINGSKSFTSEIYRMNNAVDRTTTPSQNLYSAFTFLDKARLLVGSIQHCQRTSGVNDLSFYVTGNSNESYGVRINSNKAFSPIENNTYSLGSSGTKWKNVYATTFNGNLSGTIASSTTATTQATTDNSTKIATTAWVRNYVNSVVGSGGNTLGSSISAYWSNMSYVTAAGTASSTSSNGYYPACYSDYINLTPVVGTIYSGAQLYTVLNASASARGEKKPQGQFIECTTTVFAEASFSNPINSAGKYLCTTANTVRFTAYGKGSDSGGSASVEDNTSTKSIFIRVQ